MATEILILLCAILRDFPSLTNTRLSFAESWSHIFFRVSTTALRSSCFKLYPTLYPLYHITVRFNVHILRECEWTFLFWAIFSTCCFWLKIVFILMKNVKKILQFFSRFWNSTVLNCKNLSLNSTGCETVTQKLVSVDINTKQRKKKPEFVLQIFIFYKSKSSLNRCILVIISFSSLLVRKTFLVWLQ